MIIEANCITKRFGSKVIFEELSFQSTPGELIAISGKSGAGKSTLLNIIGLLESAFTGELLFDQQKIAANSAKALRMLRYKIAYLFQNFALIDNETVAYNLNLAQKFVRASAKEKQAAKSSALSQVNLPDDILHEKVYHLSGGEQQRVALARVLLKPNEIILADEPTGSLDTENGEMIIRILKEISINKNIFIATHDEALLNVCSKVIAL